MNYLKAIIAEQRQFLTALLISVLFNLTVSIQHEYQAVTLAYRVLLILFVAVLVSLFSQFIKQHSSTHHE